MTCSGGALPRRHYFEAALQLPESSRNIIISHAESCYPLECCGILIGISGEVKWARPAANLNTERAHDRYVLDPKDQILAEKDARAQGMEVLGFYHSHPDHPARPSETDREAAWEGYTYVILGVAKGKAGEMNAFRLNADKSFEPERLT